MERVNRSTMSVQMGIAVVLLLNGLVTINGTSSITSTVSEESTTSQYTGSPSSESQTITPTITLLPSPSTAPPTLATTTSSTLTSTPATTTPQTTEPTSTSTAKHTLTPTTPSTAQPTSPTTITSTTPSTETSTTQSTVTFTTPSTTHPTSPSTEPPTLVTTSISTTPHTTPTTLTSTTPSTTHPTSLSTTPFALVTDSASTAPHTTSSTVTPTTPSTTHPTTPSTVTPTTSSTTLSTVTPTTPSTTPNTTLTSTTQPTSPTTTTSTSPTTTISTPSSTVTPTISPNFTIPQFQTSESTSTSTPFPIGLNLQLSLIPPRTMRATWNSSESGVSYQCCMYWEGTDLLCNVTEALEIRLPIPAGVEIKVFVINTNSSEQVPGSIFVPWQLGVGSTTSSSIMVEWNEGETVSQICWREINSAISATCNPVEGNSYVIRRLKEFTLYEIELTLDKWNPLTIYARTANKEIYSSLAWKCDETNACQKDGTTCFPATNGLLPETDPEAVIPPTSYNYTCRCLKEQGHHCQPDPMDRRLNSPDVIDGKGYMLSIEHGDFTEFNEFPISPFCSLPNTFSLLNYWCNGKPRCEIEYERLHSYFSVSDGCQSTEIDTFELMVRVNDMLHWNCSEKFQFHRDPQQVTCYGPVGAPSVDFVTARESCQKLGGDLAYYVNDAAFLKFLNQTFPGLSNWWTLGVLSNNSAVRPPMLHSNTVDKAYVFNNTKINYCFDGCDGVTASALCAVAPIIYAPPVIDHTGSHPGNCTSDFCENGGTCYPVSHSPGLEGEEDFSFMCRCPKDFSGLRCETEGDEREEIVESKNNFYEISTLGEGPISIESAYFGRDDAGDFLGCYSLAAMALIRLKCEGQMSCNVSRTDLQNHLSSTCHPDIPQELRIRQSYYDMDVTSLGCESGGELYQETGTCFVVTNASFNDSQEAKKACNELGGDLAYPYKDLDMCSKGNFSAWTDNSSFSHSPFYNMVVGNGFVLQCGDASGKKPIFALCELPSTTLSLTTSTSTTSPSTTTTTSPSTTTTTPRPPTQEPITNCSETTPLPELYPDFTWPSTEPGKTSTQKCPNGSDVTGSSTTWSCSYYGEWVGLPDMSQCRALNLTGWETALNDTSGNKTAGDILDDFSDSIDENIGAGDVIGVMSLVDLAKERHKIDLLNSTSEEDVYNITDKFTLSVTKISSKLLEKPKVWGGIPKDTRLITGGQLQKDVKDAAVEVSLVLKNQTKNYSYKTISVVAKQYPSDHYSEQSNRLFNHPEKDGNSIELPKNFSSSLPDQNKVAVTFTAYSTLHCVMGQTAVCEPDDLTDPEDHVEGLVNSPVMGLTVGNTSWVAEDSQEVVAIFKQSFQGDRFNLSEAQCVWWDSKNQNWNQSGCSLTENDDQSSTCSCDHLTNIAVIIDVFGRMPEIVIVITKWITIIGCSISLVCLFFVILTLSSLIRKNKNISKSTSVIHLNFCCCLTVAEIVLLAGLDATQTDGGCGFVAGLLHFLLLATFCWMGVESINVYMLLIKIFQPAASPMKYYYVIGYGIPTLIVGISLAATQGQGYGTDGYCWLDYETGLTWAFSGPALIILLMNLVVFVLSMRVLRKQNVGGQPGRGLGKSEQKTRETEMKNNKKLVKGAATLSTIMGITWLLGFIFMFSGIWVLVIIFTVVNSLQGVSLFIVLILLPEKPRAEFQRILHCQCKKEQGEHSYVARNHRNDRRGTMQYSGTEETSNYETYSRSTMPSTTSYSHSWIPEGVRIDPRGSGDLDMCVARDIELSQKATQRKF